MNDMKIGFIGAGNMASAIVGGAVKSGKFASNDIYVCDINEEKVNKLKTELGVNAAADALELINSVDTVVLAVKPNVFASLLPSVSKNINNKGTFVISIAAGKSVAEINNLLGSNVPVARVMPNINATVLEAMSAYCCNALVNDEQKLKEMPYNSLLTIYAILNIKDFCNQNFKLINQKKDGYFVVYFYQM